MFCNACGNELVDGAAFCGKCGTPCKRVNIPVQDYVNDVANSNRAIVNEDYEKTESIDNLNNGSYEESTAKFTDIEAFTKTAQLTKTGNDTAINTMTDGSNAGVYENGYDGNSGSESGDEKSSRKAPIIIICILLLLIIGGVVAFFLFKNSGDKNSKKNESEESSGNKDDGDNNTPVSEAEIDITDNTSNDVVIGVYGANSLSDAEGIIGGASITIYEGYNGENGTALYQVSSDSNGQYVFDNLPDGEYTIKVDATGFMTYIDNVTIDGAGNINEYLAPVPGDDDVIVKVDWKGNQDIDLCFYNATSGEYISAGNAIDKAGSFIYMDNSDRHYELLYLREYSSPNVRTLYVVDTNALVERTSSSMEEDGVRLTIYDKNGQIFAADADSSKTAPIWSAGYVYNGAVNLHDGGDIYVDEATTDYAWAQYLKEGNIKRIEDKVVELNTLSGGANEIDVFENNYSAAPKNPALTWDSTVFYVMEGDRQSDIYYEKNSCTLKKLELVNKRTGNVIDYDIYLNPLNSKPNKIVSIEYLDEGIEVYEYYYTADGKVNFVFHYNTDNYVPTFASPNMAGERYLFEGDNLTTWRIIGESSTPGERGPVLNWCSGDAEADRLSSSTSWPASSIKKYSTLSADEKARYDNAEEMMIDAAYNTYNAAINFEGVGRIQGYVYASLSGGCNGLGRATIELYDDKFENVIYSTETDDDGQYSIFVPAEEYSYNMKVSYDDYTSCEIYDVEMNSGKIAEYNDMVYLYDDANAGEQTVRVTLGDAFESTDYNTVRLDNADVYVRKGANNKKGDIYKEYTTDSNGYVELKLVPGMYTIEASAAGYESMYYTIAVSPYEENIYEYYAAPKLSQGEFAIVLSWGRTPSDLDSHLFTTRQGQSDHVWYSNKRDVFGNMLDVDDTDAYGPETVTVRSFQNTDYYKYYVLDYSNRNYPSSTAMSYSNATVTVYDSNGLVTTFRVPVNRNGVLWEVFEIRNGMVTPIQRYYDNLDAADWWQH